MKKYLILFAFCFMIIYANSQITITSSDMPSSGDTIRYSVGSISQDILQKYLKTGTSHDWDFSDLEPESQDIYNYQNAMQTPYGFFFIGSYGLKVTDSIGVGTYSIKNIYNFFKKSTSKFEANGMGLTFGGIPFPSFYTDNDEIYQFPLNYGRRDSSTFRISTNLAGMLQYSSTGYRINEVDGEGTITTPFGKFDCIRIKTYVYQIDSIGFSSFKIGFPNPRLEYKWLAKTIKIPVLEITGPMVNGNFTPNTLRYRDKYRKVYSPFAPVASFEADKVNVNAGEAVTFKNSSTGIMNSYQWTITPGNYFYEMGSDSLMDNPVVVFTKAGKYSIKLRAINTFGMDDSLRTDYITVSGSTSNYKPVADFIYDNDNPHTGTDVYFSDKSKVFANTTYLWTITPNTITYKWGTGQSSKNPIIRFNTEGKYFIKLSVTNVYGSHDTTKSLMVAVNNIEEESNKNIVIYPNPVNESGLQISTFLSSPSYISIEIIAIDGRKVYYYENKEVFQNFEHNISRHIFPTNGIYSIRLIYEDKVALFTVLVE